MPAFYGRLAETILSVQASTWERLMMSIESFDLPDPAVHARNLQEKLRELIDHARRDMEQVTEPRLQHYWKQQRKF